MNFTAKINYISGAGKNLKTSWGIKAANKQSAEKLAIFDFIEGNPTAEILSIKIIKKLIKK